MKLFIAERYLRFGNSSYTYEFAILKSNKTDKSLLGFYKRDNLVFINIFYHKLNINKGWV